MSFPERVIEDAWNRQGGRCAYCGKWLARANREGGETGAWHPHHRKPTSKDGTDSLRNCVILCVNKPEHCHWEIGHGGISWDYHAPLNDSKLKYLYWGVRRKPSVVRVTGIAPKMPLRLKKATKKRRQPKGRPVPTISLIRMC